jgi:RNA polymerase sigma factor (sigma-70 family)
MTDAQLLECFVTRRDEAAFAALVRRHGLMVWNVCGRLLRNIHDTEDAFQATFLVLVRKAASIVPREMVANWLYGVAFQTARKAKAVAARRQAREKQVTNIPEPAIQESEDWHDLRPVLDRELSHLPDKYRSAILYCDLEGKTRKEAAAYLGIPEGTLSGWLTRGRAILAKRLSRRGLSGSGVVLSTCAPAEVLASAMRAASGGPVSTAVASLTRGVLRTMLLNRVKRIAVVVAVLGAIGLGGGLLSGNLASADDKPAAQRPSETPIAREPTKVDRYVEAVRKDLAALQGEWELVSFVGYGKKLDLPEDRAKRTLVIKGNEAILFIGPQELRMTWLIDPTKQPKTLDVCYEKSPSDEDAEGRSFLQKVGPAIYELDGDTLKECSDDPGNPRPDRIAAPRGAHRSLMVYKRIKRQ